MYKSFWHNIVSLIRKKIFFRKSLFNHPVSIPPFNCHGTQCFLNLRKTSTLKLLIISTRLNFSIFAHGSSFLRQVQTTEFMLPDLSFQDSKESTHYKNVYQVRYDYFDNTDPRKRHLWLSTPSQFMKKSVRWCHLVVPCVC